MPYEPRTTASMEARSPRSRRTSSAPAAGAAAAAWCRCGRGRERSSRRRAGVAAQRAEHAAARAVPLDYLARLLHASGEQHTEPGSGPAAAAQPGLVEPLTARELEVLGLLGVGKSNPRIAAELVVTVDTVKKHAGHVLDKLGATNRTEAVTRARQLGLIG